jgi:hypothetical protein
MDDIDFLRGYKEKLKTMVLQDMHWQERMRLYKQIQVLQERIHQLESSEKELPSNTSSNVQNVKYV